MPFACFPHQFNFIARLDRPDQTEVETDIFKQGVGQGIPEFLENRDRRGRLVQSQSADLPTGVPKVVLELGKASESNQNFKGGFLFGPFITPAYEKYGLAINGNEEDAILEGTGVIKHVDAVKDQRTVQADAG
jgi:hypothetical protein